LYNRFFFEKRNEGMLRVTCYKEAVVALEVFTESGKAVLYGVGGVVFVVYALRAGGCGEVLVGGLLAVVSCWKAVVSGVD
jgi:hypothetical protein